MQRLQTTLLVLLPLLLQLRRQLRAQMLLLLVTLALLTEEVHSNVLLPLPILPYRLAGWQGITTNPRISLRGIVLCISWLQQLALSQLVFHVLLLQLQLQMPPPWYLLVLSDQVLIVRAYCSTTTAGHWTGFDDGEALLWISRL